MLVSTHLSVAEVEKTHPQLLLEGFTHLFLPQLVEKFMCKGLSSVQTFFGGVNHNLGEEIQQKRISFGKNLKLKEKYMFPLSFLDFREFVIVEVVFWVHLDNLGLSRSPHHLDYLY